MNSNDLMILMCKIDAIMRALGLDPAPEKIVPLGHYVLYSDGKMLYHDRMVYNNYLDCMSRLYSFRYRFGATSEFSIIRRDDLYDPTPPIMLQDSDVDPTREKPHFGGSFKRFKDSGEG